MKNIEPKMGNKQTRLNGICNSVGTLGAIRFYFHFGDRKYSVVLNTVTGSTSLIILHKDLDNMGLSYQTFYKVIERHEDRYSKKAEMQNYLPFLVFPKYSFRKSTQLRNIH